MIDDTTLKNKLLADVDRLPWAALVRHFAYGRVYRVRAPWTVVDAALVLNRDHAEELRSAMNDGHFGIPSDEEVKAWHDTKQEFHVLVISPFVLIEAIASTN